MTLLWSALVAPAAAVFTPLIRVFAASMVSRRAQDWHWARDQQTAACARVLRESAAVMVDLSEMDAARPHGVPQGVLIPTSVDRRPWNEAISMVNLVADQDIVETAHALDEQIWRMHIAIRRGPTTAEGWVVLRSRVESVQRHFVTVARRRLSVAGDGLRRLSGRPEPADPVWSAYDA
jgi:hypothetical protein